MRISRAIVHHKHYSKLLSATIHTFFALNQESVTVKIWIMNLAIFFLPQNFRNKFCVKLKCVTLLHFPISVLTYSSISPILDGFGRADTSRLLKWVQNISKICTILATGVSGVLAIYVKTWTMELARSTCLLVLGFIP